MTHLKAAVFDWAGTVIDFGSRAPMGVFVEAFAKFDIEVSVAEAREPMGRPKWDHIAAMLDQPRIRQVWADKHGTEPTKADIDRIYAVFVPMNEAVVHKFADLVPGAQQIAARLRDMGLKIGSTTGYTRSIMERLLPLAKAQGYETDNLVCAGDLPEGRPTPMNMYRCVLDLNVWPASAVVKIDDTGVGIDEGVAAGCWTVGVALSGNEAGVTVAELAAMTKTDVDALREKATQTLTSHGADYVIDTVADLMPVITDIEARLARGERPVGTTYI
ncbi:phosphonoacetaldehyde hydrolase [Rhizobium tumorigenes]|uniref:phosphonoacetaldehyde hydrolase n=1 Tax=Rhizobium tumorigenes TaxID=2041385 RepID=UPI00241BF928|nr:phosphonoacetaldehyde hydrolase [Rhizobium tumorigenes]WFS03469.1 phosphonoacetaldehyde hydrolase [Rhizobium tumorigenes]